MRTWPLFLGATLLAGCTAIFDPSGGDNSFAPRISSSFPEPGTQLLAEDGTLLFSAEGEDDDSLVLEWVWEVDGDPQVLGDSSDGLFDTSFDLAWRSEWSGATVEVRFLVDDGELSAELVWPVDVE